MGVFLCSSHCPEATVHCVRMECSCGGLWSRQELEVQFIWKVVSSGFFYMLQTQGLCICIRASVWIGVLWVSRTRAQLKGGGTWKRWTLVGFSGHCGHAFEEGGGALTASFVKWSHQEMLPYHRPRKKWDQPDMSSNFQINLSFF